MGEIDIISLIGQTGFPIAVAAYLLVKFDKTIKELSNAVNTLSAKLGDGK